MIALLGVALIAVLAALAWRTWQLRTMRALVFVSAASAFILLAGLIPLRAAALVQVSAWTAAMYVLLFRRNWFARATDEEGAFVEGLIDELDGLDRLSRRLFPVDPDGHVLGLEAATQRIARLEAPDEELAAVRDEAVEGLNRILVTIRSPEPMTDEAFERVIAGWAKFQTHFVSILSRRFGVWPALRTKWRRPSRAVK